MATPTPAAPLVSANPPAPVATYRLSLAKTATSPLELKVASSNSTTVAAETTLMATIPTPAPAGAAPLEAATPAATVLVARLFVADKVIMPN